MSSLADATTTRVRATTIPSWPNRSATVAAFSARLRREIDLAGMGILLVACAFIWPTVSVECCGVDQPTIAAATTLLEAVRSKAQTG